MGTNLDDNCKADMQAFRLSKSTRETAMATLMYIKLPGILSMRIYLAKVLFKDKISYTSILELPLLVTFMHKRMSSKAVAQFGFSGRTARNAPVHISSNVHVATCLQSCGWNHSARHLSAEERQNLA